MPKKAEDLSNEEVEKLLEDYEEVESVNDLKQVPLGTHIRYFLEKDGKTIFRYGGTLFDAKGVKKGYILLQNGQKRWSVQLKNASIWRRVSIDEVKDEYDEYVKELEKENNELKQKLIKYKQKYDNAKTELKRLEYLLRKIN